MLVCFACLMTACGGTSDDDAESAGTGSENASDAGTETTAETEYENFVFKVSTADNYVVSIEDNMADVLAALGDPQSYYEAASCAFDGLDKIYTYAGFTISTYPDGDNDYINSILLTDDSVSTAEGIYIGCTEEDVIAAYGECDRLGNVLKYTKGSTAINFVFEDDTVISIEYLQG